MTNSELFKSSIRLIVTYFMCYVSISSLNFQTKFLHYLANSMKSDLIRP